MRISDWSSDLCSSDLAMLHHCLTSWKDDAFRIFVGCYPNDPATISAVMAVAERDSRISIVIGPEPGPTTKGDCLNAIWKAMQQKEEAQGWLFKAVVLHDAEDIVPRGEIRLFDPMRSRESSVGKEGVRQFKYRR